MQSSSNTLSKTLLWVARGHEGYGVSSTMLALTQQLQHRGWRVMAVCLTNGVLIEQLKAVGCEVICLEVESPIMLSGGVIEKIRQYFITQKSQKMALNKALQMLAGESFTAIQTCSPLYLKLTSQLARKLGGQAIWRMASSIRSRQPLNVPRWLLQWQCWRGNIMAMANSDYTAGTLRPGPAQICANHHGCDPKRFTVQSKRVYSRAEVGIPDNACVFGIVARIDETGDKGQLRFLQALIRLGEKVASNNIHLLLLGGPMDTPHASEIKAFAESNDFSSRLHMLGFVSDAERYYSLIDVAVNCRLTAEPFGLSVIEAMMAATPVLAYSLGGPGETIIDNETGWLVSSVDVPALAGGIERALASRGHWLEIGAAAHNHSMYSYTIERETDRWLGFLT